MIKGRPPRLNPIFTRYDAPIFFVTACTLHRQKFPSLEETRDAFIRYAKRAQSFNIAVGRYVMMPDHMHFFVCGDRQFVLSEWMKGLKRGIANRFTSTGKDFRWQPGFFDHLLRNDESYGQKWNYIRLNPVRAQLVTRADDWPYAGEIVYIDRA
jgi:putative transposase